MDKETAAEKAEAIVEKVMGLMTTEPVWKQEETGDIRFTEYAQDLFLEVLAILERAEQ